MHHAMPHRSQGVAPDALLQPIDQQSAAAPGREKLSAGCAPFITSSAWGSPMRSMLPSSTRRSASRVSNTANLMLDEPPLMVRMRELSGIMGVWRNAV